MCDRKVRRVLIHTGRIIAKDIAPDSELLPTLLEAAEVFSASVADEEKGGYAKQQHVRSRLRQAFPEVPNRYINTFSELGYVVARARKEQEK